MSAPVFSSERRSEMIEVRVTPTQRAFVREQAKRLGVSESEVIRMALDRMFSQLSEAGSSSGSPVVESKRAPGSSTAKVKAASKRVPSKKTGRKHSSH